MVDISSFVQIQVEDISEMVDIGVATFMTTNITS